MKRKGMTTVLFIAVLMALSTAIGRAVDGSGRLVGTTPGAASATTSVDRGAYLVKAMGCNDCHTPWKMGPRGPEPDWSRALAGHPSDVVIAEIPQLPAAPWTWMGTATNTAFAGPWGLSFTANLTPDPETGLGKWTEEMFIATLRTGRHEGKGRPLLPPMPWSMIGTLTDEDLKSIFAYLQSLPPVRNRVPAPIDPPESQ